MNQIPTAIIALTALASPLLAQSTNRPTATNPPPVTVSPPKNLLPPGPTPLTNSIDNLKPSVTIVAPTPTADKPDRPPLLQAIPPVLTDVKIIVERFQTARDDIIRRMQASSLLPRPDPITEQLRLDWLETRRALQEEFRARLLEIRNEFRNSELREVLDAARDAAQRTRTRVGED